MITQIQIGGKLRPFALGHGMHYFYETTTGKSYVELCMRVGETLSAGASLVPREGRDNVANVAIEDAAAQLFSDSYRHKASAFSVVPLTDLIYQGLLYAHGKEKVDVDFDASDVAEWLFSDSSAQAAVLKVFFDSLQLGVKDAEPKGGSGSKKKQTIRKRVPKA